MRGLAFKPRVNAPSSQRPVFHPNVATPHFITNSITSSTGVRLPCHSSPGGSSALTVYEIGDDVAAQTPAFNTEVEEPTPAPTPEVDEDEYEELGCAVDLTDGVRVRATGSQKQVVGDNCNARSIRAHLRNDAGNNALMALME